ncbi:hypothetical protein D9619_012147 [Psilocybe cf. subviscida]|uniref:Uncharacterized protein n=1 Tax=Psilocybe cf. subviscida TaxID=2480587 RepID=A0A8H5EZT8_9AGAR|nr:hypothetical protein D9619_012147 [Psilocybe cf. subviscida]
MSHISRQPLPSIALVLTTDHTRIPRLPPVIRNAPRPPAPTKRYTSQFDPMKTIHSRDLEVQSFQSSYGDESCSQKKHGQRPHVVFVEEVEPMDIAESMHGMLTNDDHVGLGAAIKRKLSSALFAFRRFLCVVIPQTCFCQVSRH